MDIFICMYISEKDHKQKCWQWWGSSRGDVGLPIMMLNLQKYCRNVLFPIDRQPNNLQFMNETETLHSVKSWCQNWEGAECGHWDLWMSQSFRFLTWEILWSRWWTQRYRVLKVRAFCFWVLVWPRKGLRRQMVITWSAEGRRDAVCSAFPCPVPGVDHGSHGSSLPCEAPAGPPYWFSPWLPFPLQPHGSQPCTPLLHPWLLSAWCPPHAPAPLQSHGHDWYQTNTINKVYLANIWLSLEETCWKNRSQVGCDLWLGPAILHEHWRKLLQRART